VNKPLHLTGVTPPGVCPVVFNRRAAVAMREKPWVVSFCGEGGNPGLAMAECSPAPSVGLRVLQGAEADRSPLLREGR